jgi:flagellum-specific peptidoglycan hydrolase FlgJ
MRFHLLSPEEINFQSEPFLFSKSLSSCECPEPNSSQVTPSMTLSSVERKKASPQREFIQRYASYAIYTQRMTGIPASVTLAQAALESGWGKHAPGNNFFGIKGRGPAGCQCLWTKENNHGQTLRIQTAFRKYEDPLQCFLDHARVISTGRYLRHAMQHTQSAESFVTALQSGKAKYATDPLYAQKIMDIIHRYQLENYDGRMS